MKAMEDEVRVARGATSLYFATLANVVLLTGYFVVLTNVLPPTEVGLATVLNVVVLGVSTLSLLASPVVGAGLSTSPPAISRFLSQYIGDGRGKAARRILFISLALTLSISLASFLVLSYGPVGRAIAHPLSSRPVAFAGLDAVVFSLGQVGAYALIGTGRAGKAGIYITGSVVARYAVAAAFVFAKLGVAGVFLGFALGDAVLPVLSIPVALRAIPNQGGSETDSRVLAGYMATMLLAGMIGFATSQGDRIIAFYQTGLANLAIYNLVSVGGNITALAPVALTNVLVPMLGGLKADEVEERKDMLRRYTRYVSLAVFPIGFGLAAVSPSLLSVFGKAYVSAGPLVAVMAISVSFTAVSAVYSADLIARKRTSLFLLGNVFALVTLVTVADALAPTQGLLGVAIGRAAMLFVTLVAFAAFMRASGNLVFDFSSYLKGMAGSAIMGGVVYGLLAVLISSGYFHTRLTSIAVGAFMVPIGLLVYLAVIKTMRTLNESDFEFLEKLLPESLKPLTALARKYLLL